MKTISAYYEVTKPGIVYGNLLVAVAGFIYGSAGVNWALFAATLAGLGLIIACACVFNNIYDCDIDARMPRTKHRPLASGAISESSALCYGLLLGLVGILVLFLGSTMYALTVAVAGLAVYVFAYTPLKHKTPHALWVGAVAGATPPVVGYVAASNLLDTKAWWLFIFLFVWQVPHFLGIAAYRWDEYAAAGVPMLIKRPSERGKKIGRYVFLVSLVVLLAWCGALMLHR